LKFRQEVLCIGGESRVTVRDKATGVVMTVSMEELTLMLNRSPPQ
jgi:hypothetical protein